LFSEEIDASLVEQSRISFISSHDYRRITAKDNLLTLTNGREFANQMTSNEANEPDKMNGKRSSG
jgi:hypothetical protein